MLDQVFMQILDMTAQGSIVIGAVLLIRLLLKGAPKVFSYALWGVVLFRLLCPVTLEAPVSIVPKLEPVSQSYTLTDTPVSVLSAGVAAYQAVGDVLNGGVDHQLVHTQIMDDTGKEQTVSVPWEDVWILFGQYVWLAGLLVMVVYSLMVYLRLRRKLIGSMAIEGNIYLTDHIQSPFVLGLFRPRIYLPSQLPPAERTYILAHEKHHIRRGDPVIKLIAYLALTLHWFNPLVWLAYRLFCKDMEMSCDEAVIRKLGSEIRSDYAASLLKLATGRRGVAITPLAFGEGDTGGRIRNLAKWKKPLIWVSILAGVLCAAAAVCLLTDPVENEVADILGKGYLCQQRTQTVKLTIPTKELPETVFSEKGCTWEDNGIRVGSVGATEFYLQQVRYANEGQDWLYVTVDCHYDLSKDSGKIYYPYTMEDDGTSSNSFQIANTSLYCGENVYEDAVKARGLGPDTRLWIYIATDVFRALWQMDCEVSFNVILNEINYIKYGANAGETLGETESVPLLKEEETPLDKAVSAAILSHYRKEKPDGLLQVESHKILAKEEVSGTPLAGSNEPTNLVTVYLVYLHMRYNVEGMTVEEGEGSYSPAVLTFSVDPYGGYSLTEHWEPEPGNYKESILKKFPENVVDIALDDAANGEELLKLCYPKALQYQSQHQSPDMLANLKKQYPQYFGLRTGKGLGVYLWQPQAGDFLCGLLPGRNMGYTQEELDALVGVPIPVMQQIVLSYQLPKNMIAVIPLQKTGGYAGITDWEKAKELFWGGYGTEDIVEWTPGEPVITSISSTEEESSYMFQTWLPGMDFSGLTQEVLQKVNEEWEHYDSLSVMEQMQSSHLWGTVYLTRDSWEQCTQMLGLPIQNPLAQVEGLEILPYFGSESTDPEVPANRVTVYANAATNRQISQITLRGGYRLDKVDISLTATVVPTAREYSTGAIYSGYRQFASQYMRTGSGHTVLAVLPVETGEYASMNAYWEADGALYDLHLVDRQTCSGDVLLEALKTILPQI